MSNVMAPGPLSVVGSTNDETHDIMTYGGLIYVSNHAGRNRELYLRGEGQVDQALYLDSQQDSDFSQSVFVVCPQLRYVASEALTEQYEKLAADIRRAGDDKERSQRQLDRLNTAIQADAVTNQGNEDKMRGIHVRFGDVVQLRHCKSHQFLTLRPEMSASLDLGSMRTRLHKLGDSGSHFRVDPGFKHRTVGDRVQIGDHVVLHNARFMANLRLEPAPDSPNRVELIAAKNVSQVNSLFQVFN